MTVSLQVFYPALPDSRFDHAYYAQTHMELVGRHMGQYLERAIAVRGLSGGPETPAPYHAVATLLFATQEDMKAAMKASGPVMADIANFTDVEPQILIGALIS
ncbi:EthD family reductase [Cribrihabitans pelagius]|uniref:EthD family reductase n=1 Tax=Cribrihabitans pelagius TaxID=1765746 RepID=UPI003B59CEA5